MRHIEAYLEIGTRRVFACAVDWPGWCRSGPEEASALHALVEYGPRYAAVMRSTRLGFTAPTRVQELRVVERLPGNATTDFGTPGVIPSADRWPVRYFVRRVAWHAIAHAWEIERRLLPAA